MKGRVRASMPLFRLASALCISAGLLPPAAPAAEEKRPDNVPPPGFTALFNGEDLSGWKGLVADPPKRERMSEEDLARAQAEADRRMREHWSVEDGVLVFDGKGKSLCTAKDYADFELFVDWKIHEKGDSGIYLRGTPQVQIWDPAQHGGVGSGGLYNNKEHPGRPLITADRPIGEWNTFRIIMVGERVTVYLNDLLVVNDIPLENYWERSEPIYPAGQLELQDHGNKLYFKNIYLRELPRVSDRVRLDAPIVDSGDLVAVVGDSITEQKLYSRFIEDYLLACVPELDLRVVQLGWSGERAPGFAARMENDLLPLRPDVVTTCYGMNDGLYRPYTEEIGATYRRAMEEIVYRLKQEDAKVVVGSPGAVDAHTFRRRDLPPAVYNENLARLRDIARRIAIESGMPFANVHDPMINAQLEAKPVLGEGYHVCGGDGFHPAPNGHVIMAYAFLKSMGFDGEIGRIAVDLGKDTASVTEGHRILAVSGGRVELESSRYPFCFYGDEKSPSATRSILPYVPFQRDLNRLALVVKGLGSERGRVTWGDETKSFSRKELEEGINLAAEFLENPFSEPFRRVDELVAEKQRYETPMIKDAVTRFRRIRELTGESLEAEAAMETLRRKLLQRDEDLHRRARRAIVPVRHTLVIEAE